MAPRKRIDWEIGDKLIRAGQLSTREIARQLGCDEKTIRKRKKEKGIEADLSSRVQEKVRTELVRTSVRIDNASEKEIIDSAAATVVEVVRTHRKDISKLAQLEQKLLDELGDEGNPPTKLYIGQYQGKTVEKIIGITVTERASALQALAGVQHKRIQLERQAFSIPDGTQPSENEKSAAEYSDSELEAILNDGD